MNSGFTEPARLVVRDEAAWRSVSVQLRGASDSAHVDFSHSMVIVAALGRQRSGGYSVRIESVQADAGNLVVTVIERSPGAACSVSAALTSPADAVIVARSDAPVTFRSVQETASCTR